MLRATLQQRNQPTRRCGTAVSFYLAKAVRRSLWTKQPVRCVRYPSSGREAAKYMSTVQGNAAEWETVSLQYLFSL